MTSNDADEQIFLRIVTDEDVVSGVLCLIVKFAQCFSWHLF
jgi:hypothetical protein